MCDYYDIYTPSADELKAALTEARQERDIAILELVLLKEEHQRLLYWAGMSSSEMRQRAGEMTTQEYRTVQAVLNAILTENQTHAKITI